MDFACIHVLIRSKAKVLVIKVFWFLSIFFHDFTNKHFNHDVGNVEQIAPARVQGKRTYTEILKSSFS